MAKNEAVDQTPIPQMDDANARFWTERAAKQRAEAAKREPYQPTSLGKVLTDNEAKRKAEQAAKQPSEDTHMLRNHLLQHLPPNDPLVQEAKKAYFGQSTHEAEMATLRAELAETQQSLGKLEAAVIAATTGEDK
jgi:hypothetical protein